MGDGLTGSVCQLVIIKLPFWPGQEVFREIAPDQNQCSMDQAVKRCQENTQQKLNYVLLVSSF